MTLFKSIEMVKHRITLGGLI